MYQRVFFGAISNMKNLTLQDIPVREVVVLAPLIAMIVWVGVYPKPFLDRMGPSVARFIEMTHVEPMAERGEPEARAAWQAFNNSETSTVESR